MSTAIAHLTYSEEAVSQLAALMVDVVAGDGSIGFLHPLPFEDASAYWREALRDPGRIVFAGRQGGGVAGTVTLHLGTPPNQPHRAEIWKLMVAPAARRAGLAEALMRAAEQAAMALGRTVLNLDTVQAGPASRLYERLGWTRVGEIPAYALTPLGELTATTIYFKQL